MGTITKLIKSGASSAMSQIKNSVNIDSINSQLSAAGSSLQIPKLEMLEVMKNMKLNIDPSVLKMPAGIDNYISPVTKAISNAAGVKLPSEINGVPLPQLPDLFSVSSELESHLSGLGFDADKLGIRNISDILKEPDLSALKKVQFASPVDLNNMPDLTESFDGFDLSEVQSEIDKISKELPGVDSIDISKYF